MRARSLALLLTFGAIACEQPVDPVATDVAPQLARHMTGPAVVAGEIGPGALYELHLPEGWNGGLALYAHGYQGPIPRGVLPNIDPLRDALLDLGYGVAYSSYSQGGWAIEDGVTRTRQLRGLFASNFGPPSRTYVMGHSMGGLITVMATERNPGLYDGALSMCGVTGGTRFLFDYFDHVRVLFDYFYPGVIPGSPIAPPEGIDLDAVSAAIAGAIFLAPEGALQIASTQQTPMPFGGFGELVEMVITALAGNLVATPDLVDRQHGHNAFDNSETLYAGTLDDDEVNAGVARFEATADAMNSQRRAYQPTGDLRIPLITLHTSRDPLVPQLNQVAYGNVVAAAGNSSLLFERTIERFGHCTFTVAEQVAALEDLAAWAEDGVPPTP